jgi:hypothetical protein
MNSRVSQHCQEGTATGRLEIWKDQDRNTFSN